MDSELSIDKEGLRPVPTEFSRCIVYLKCGDQSHHFGHRLGYDINRECEVILGLGSTKYAQEIDFALMKLATGDVCSLTLLDEHNISHIIDVSLISFEAASSIIHLNFSEITERAMVLKEKGTLAFQAKQVEPAFYLYSRALKYLTCALHSMVLKGTDNETQDKEHVRRTKCSCLLNLAACQLMGTNIKGVIRNCSEALDIEPNNIKALFRRAQAHSKLGDFESAIFDLKKALEIDPGNRGIVSALAEAKKSLRNENLLMANRLKGIFR